MNNFIKDYWEKQGKVFNKSYEASWADKYAIEIEIEEISKYINKGDYILDVGCANGFSTFHYVSKNPKKIVGIDLAESMVRNAKISASELKVGNKVSFEIGDAKNLKYDDSEFDITLATRVLINIPSWSEQKIAINELLRVTKKGGLVILSEAFYEPLALLNSMRQLVNLPLLYEHDFNRYIKKAYLDKFLNENNYKYDCKETSSIYYLGSRFLRELITEFEDYEGYSNPINKDFFKLEKKYSGGGFGIQQLYIIYN